MKYNQWINVNDRFPFPECTVIFISDGKQYMGVYDKIYDKEDDCMRFAFLNNSLEELEYKNVTHWMPIPDYPEEFNHPSECEMDKECLESTIEYFIKKKSDKCEWTKTQDIHELHYNTSCKELHKFSEFSEFWGEIDEFKFCPYCGKEIINESKDES